MNGEDLARITDEENRIKKSQPHQIHVCVAAACLSAHSEGLKEAFVKEIKRKGIEHECKVKGVGCLGLCAQAPLVSVESEGVLYHATSQDVPRIVEGLGKEPVKELQVSLNVPFFSRQYRVVLDN